MQAIAAICICVCSQRAAHLRASAVRPTSKTMVTKSKCYRSPVLHSCLLLTFSRKVNALVQIMFPVTATHVKTCHLATTSMCRRETRAWLLRSAFSRCKQTLRRLPARSSRMPSLSCKAPTRVYRRDPRGCADRSYFALLACRMLQTRLHVIRPDPYLPVKSNDHSLCMVPGWPAS